MAGLLELQTEVHTTLNGVGISIPGIVDTRRSEIVAAPDLGWRNVQVAKIIESVYDPCLRRHVTIDNEANSSALAEQWFGKNLKQKSNIKYSFRRVSVQALSLKAN